MNPVICQLMYHIMSENLLSAIYSASYSGVMHSLHDTPRKDEGLQATRDECWTLSKMLMRIEGNASQHWSVHDIKGTVSGHGSPCMGNLEIKSNYSQDSWKRQQS